MLRRLPGARLVALAVAIVAMAAGSPGCESPTLPLPPPAVPGVAPGPDANHVRLFATCGGAEPNAVIVIVNTNASVPPDEAVGGSIANGCGAWDALVYAHVGDYLQITQEYGTTRSTPIDVQVLTP
jgi:hypothetical protein